LGDKHRYGRSIKRLPDYCNIVHVVFIPVGETPLCSGNKFGQYLVIDIDGRRTPGFEKDFLPHLDAA
jgi:hypothetical protein